MMLLLFYFYLILMVNEMGRLGLVDKYTEVTYIFHL